MRFSNINNQLAINNLSCIRGERVLFRKLSLNVQCGKLLFVQGSNGSGKTSLLRTISGLSTPASGEINWNNQNIYSLNEEYFVQLLYLGHMLGIKDDLTPVENLQFSVSLHGYYVTEEQVIAALEKLDISRCAHLPTRVLSQGQKRRVALAQLWLQDNPEQKPLWVLDEPFTALDSSAIEILSTHIQFYVNNGGIVIFTSHQTPSFDANSMQSLQLQ